MLIDVDSLNFGNVSETDADGAKAVIKSALMSSPSSKNALIALIENDTSDAHCDNPDEFERLKRIAIEAL